MGMESMGPRLGLLLPEVILFAGAVVASVIGLSRSAGVRRSVPFWCVVSLAAAAVASVQSWTPERAEAAQLLFPAMGAFVKPLLAVMGILLLLPSIGAIDRAVESAVASGRQAFDALRVMRGEHYAFALFSIAGAMLICGASDLIWLFLALELVSLPTYIMVALGRSNRKAQEAGVKYFFLGALSTALFLYGFALIYGSTGTLQLAGIRDAFAAQAAAGGIDMTGIAGLCLAVLGLCFKITAVPMHFYAPDVYEGAAVHVSAFLAFIPKAAGFVALTVVLGTAGWTGHALIAADGVRVAYMGLPEPVAAVLWMSAVLTMTLGNVGALMQRSIKRTLAYSSVSHSGYMMIGLIVGVPAGIDALFFYLLCYGIMTTASFAALAAIERSGEEIDTFDDIAGLRVRHPMMAWVLATSAVSLVGIPPMIGFFGKLALFMAAFESGQVALVVIAVVNSAVSAWYYLRIAIVPLVAPPSARSAEVVLSPSRWPAICAVVCGVGSVVVPLAAARLLTASQRASEGYRAPDAAVVESDMPHDGTSARYTARLSRP
jgi:NADH-quinone oxidoreductase subunit N